MRHSELTDLWISETYEHSTKVSEWLSQHRPTLMIVALHVLWHGARSQRRQSAGKCVQVITLHGAMMQRHVAAEIMTYPQRWRLPSYTRLCW